MTPGDIVTAGGEQVTVIQIGDDGWIQVRYPDGDLVWTPPERVEVSGGEPGNVDQG